jgi:hypothetical protein
VAYVPEGRGVFPNLSVRENLVMAARRGVDGRNDWSFERVPGALGELCHSHGLRWRGAVAGGDGGVRRVRFLEPMTASMLSNGRIHGAFGMAGGQSGQPGINRVVRSDGMVESLGHIGQAEMLPGDVFEVHTPGGGGYGPPEAVEHPLTGVVRAA